MKELLFKNQKICFLVIMFGLINIVFWG